MSTKITTVKGPEATFVAIIASLVFFMSFSMLNKFVGATGSIGTLRAVQAFAFVFFLLAIDKSVFLPMIFGNVFNEHAVLPE